MNFNRLFLVGAILMAGFSDSTIKASDMTMPQCMCIVFLGVLFLCEAIYSAAEYMKKN